MAEKSGVRPAKQWILFFSVFGSIPIALYYGFHFLEPLLKHNPWYVTLTLFVALCYAAGPSPLVLFVVYFLVPGYKLEWWSYLVDTLGSKFHIVVTGIFITQFITYWGNGFVLLAIDLSGAANWCKIQPNRPNVWAGESKRKDAANDWNFAHLKKVTLNLLFNQFVVINLFGVFGYVTNYARVEPTLPSHLEVLFHLLIFVYIDELLYYYGHRLLHSRRFYSKFHKQHHEFRAPVGLAAIYCHPIEMFFANLVPLFGGFWFFQLLGEPAHAYTLYIWTVVAILGTQSHHCGYNWPWMQPDEQPNFHDFHHEKFNCNYGSMGWLDWFHRTDTLYISHLNALSKKVV